MRGGLRRPATSLAAQVRVACAAARKIEVVWAAAWRIGAGGEASGLELTEPVLSGAAVLVVTPLQH